MLFKKAEKREANKKQIRNVLCQEEHFFNQFPWTLKSLCNKSCSVCVFMYFVLYHIEAKGETNVYILLNAYYK